MPKVKTLPKSQRHLIPDTCGSFHRSGSITGMKRMYYGKDALLVRCGSFIYNVTGYPEIYNNADWHMAQSRINNWANA